MGKKKRNVLVVVDYQNDFVDGITGKTDEENLGVAYKDIESWIKNGGFPNCILELVIKSRHKQVPVPVWRKNQ